MSLRYALLPSFLLPLLAACLPPVVQRQLTASPDFDAGRSVMVVSTTGDYVVQRLESQLFAAGFDVVHDHQIHGDLRAGSRRVTVGDSTYTEALFRPVYRELYPSQQADYVLTLTGGPAPGGPASSSS